MEIIEEIQETRKKVKRYCDDCGADIHWSLSCEKAICEICGKMLCEKCIGHERGTSGDYRIVYCKSCSDKYNQYKSRLDQLLNEYHMLYNKYREEAKAARHDFR